MKKVFLLMVVSAMLVTLGLAQSPDPGNNGDAANVKGCLGGSDGAYTVAEDGTRTIFKITTSGVDLKPHVGHDVKLTGHKTNGTVSSGAADNSFAVTELSMISDHCAVAAAAAVAVAPYSQTAIEPTAGPAAPSAPASTPAVDVAAPAATAGPAPSTTPAVNAAAPAVAASPSSSTVSVPAVDAAPPAVSPSSTTLNTPAVDAAATASTANPPPAPTATPAADDAQPTQPSAHVRKRPATPAAEQATEDAPTASPSSEVVSPPPAEPTTPAAADGPPAETAATPDAAAPTPTVTHRAGSLPLLVSFVVLVIILGTMAPLIGRWRKRKMLERNGSPNLSFTNEVNPSEAIPDDLNKPGPRKVA